MSTEEAMAFAQDKNLLFFEISALSGENVQGLFNEIARNLTGIESDIVQQSKIIATDLPDIIN